MPTDYEKEDEDEDLIIVPTAVQHTAAGTRKPSINSNKEECLTKLQNLKLHKRWKSFYNGISLAALDKNTTSTPSSIYWSVDQLIREALIALNMGIQDDSDMPQELKIFSRQSKGLLMQAFYVKRLPVVTDFNNLPTKVAVSPIPTLRIHNIHPQIQILGDPKSSVQTRSRVKQTSRAHALEEPKNISEVDLPHGAKEEGIDYDEVFAHVARIEAIRLFLHFASFYGVIVYHNGCQKLAFLYGTLDEEVYVSQPPGFVIYGSSKKVYKVVKALYGLIKPLELVTPKTSHLNAVKRIFKYLKGKPNLGLWYPRESSFDLEAFSDSDYAGANLYRKSTTKVNMLLLQVACDKSLWIQIKCWTRLATASTLADGTLELRATIDTIEYTITEASVRSKLQLADALGICMLPNTEIFEGLGNMGYPTDGSFTFWKSFFTPQWRFLMHHILHCISPKSGEWDQFGSNIATGFDLSFY
ncbi:putative ribonuclease H-like domain-containing protein [Tanacetum coccineum]